MDSICSNSSDSDISDDWNFINVKEATSNPSETESIEVLEDDENDVDCSEQTEDNITRNDEKSANSTDQVLELTVSSVEEVAVQEKADVAVRYCVFPEEYHNVFSQPDSSVNTSELVCSISLVILCTVASSFMVISTDGIMPSFIDVLVWQGLPESQKDFNINNPGLIIQQLKARNDLLENKFNHLSLAVQAFEENMISETALAEFVVDWQKSVKSNGYINTGKVEDVDEQFMSSLPISRQSREFKTAKVIDNGVHYNINGSVDQENKFKSDETTYNKENIRSDADTSKFTNERNEKPVTLLNRMLSLINATSETGSQLNKATLLLLNTKDKLELFKTSIQSSSSNIQKFDKLNDRLRNIENKISSEINRFFSNFSKTIYANILNFDQNVNDFICKNSEISKMSGSRLNNLCVGKNKRNLKENNKFKIKGDERNPIDKKDKWSHKYNSYKTDEDTIGKSNEINMKFDHNKDKKKVYKKNERMTKDYSVKTKSIEKYSEFGPSEGVDKSFGIKQGEINVQPMLVEKEYTKQNNYKETKNNKEKSNKIKSDKENIKLESVANYHEARTNNKKHNEKYKPYERNEGDRKHNYNLRSTDFESSFSDETLEKPIDKSGDNFKQHKNQHYEYDRITMKRKEKPTNFKMEGNENNQFKIKEKKDKQNNDRKSIYKDFKDDQVKKNDDKYKRKAFSDVNNNGNFKNNKEKEKKTSKDFNHKMTLEDIKKVKEDILNSVNGYIDHLLTNFAGNEYMNNTTKFTDSQSLSGDWFLTLGKLRSELREKDRKSDWMFNRAEGRHSLRDLSTESPYDKTYWFFRRAWERNRIRL